MLAPPELSSKSACWESVLGVRKSAKGVVMMLMGHWCRVEEKHRRRVFVWALAAMPFRGKAWAAWLYFDTANSCGKVEKRGRREDTKVR